MELNDIAFRTLAFANPEETWSYYRTFWDLPLAYNDYFTPRSDAFVAEWIEKARSPQERAATFAGIALHRQQIVGLHIVRRFEEYEQIGAHIAGLWVHPAYRRRGIARALKRMGEEWARSVGATFLNTNVQGENQHMVALARAEGFTLFRYNMRKRL
jgi:GNAT superfamily N-acetyltransferase